ncbi:Brevis radix (BRX) domain-containing protein [Hirschfeldia incana]|nr:Brevis radix (BRX) domain-containing protein [Hirschfeldia incana]
MGEQHISATVPRDRTDEQAILALKKGAQLLKCRRRGNPRFCPFKLSMDEKYLIWYSGQDERQLRLSSVITIVRGQITPNFQKQAQPDRKEQSFSLIYANGEHTLDLICKDKAQADSWFKGLRAVITKHHNSRSSVSLRTSRGAQSCINSPAGFIRRKQNLGLLEQTPDFTQIRSLCASPSTLLLEERCGLSGSSDSFYSVESAGSDEFSPLSPYYDHNSRRSDCDQTGSSQRFYVSPPHTTTQPTARSNVLKDIMIWGATRGLIEGSKNHQSDALSPQLLESATMFDVQSISLGAKHAALVTRQGEVFCWGDGNSGKLGLKVNLDVDHPKRVESLEGVVVGSVACSDHQTCGVTSSGEMYLWGKDGGTIGEESGRQFLTRKITDAFGGSLRVHSVACGAWHTAIVTFSGQLYTYGSGTFGVLGHGSVESVTKPKEVESLKRMKVLSVSCGPWHTAAVVETSSTDRRYHNGKSCGKLFTWGDGDKGRLGHVDSKKMLVPTCVSELIDQDFVKVSCGWTLTVALSSRGTVYTMGSSIHGQLGCPRAKDKSINAVSGNLTRQFVKEIACGSHHVAVLTSFGNVYTWGKGANGQLGLGDVRDRNSPVLVESLGDRLVESVACGLSLTAAICLHKEISLTDQSACSSCKSAFGFTRKKHNCYNCGLLFCNACSSKKAVNASLAPNKGKQSRVCDSCFNHLWRRTEFSNKVKTENHTPRVATARRVSDEWTESESENQNIPQANGSSDGQPRWGQVSAPSLFHFDKMSLALTSPEQISVSSRRPSCTKTSTTSETNKILIDEIERLKAQIRNLQKQCELGNEKIEECQREFEKTSEVAKEEAEKANVAKEIIKAMASRLQTNKEKPNNPKIGIACNPSQVSPIFDDSVSPYLTPITTTCSQSKDKQIVEKCSSHGSNIRLLVDASPAITRTSHLQNGTQESTAEQVEQYEPGVYITFTALPCGQKTLKRVRFSRKRFSEKEAQRWWVDKQVLVYNKYDAEV